MIQAVFFDFDQTLFSHRTMHIPSSAVEAIHTLQEKGIRCVLATGRHLTELRKFPEVFDAGLDGFVTIDGQLVLDGNLNVIHSCEIEGRNLEDLLGIFNERRIRTILVEKDCMYANMDMPQDLKDNIKPEVLLKHPVREYSGKPVYLGVIYVSPEEEADLHRRLPLCSFLRWSNNGIDVLPEGNDKVTGIEAYLKHYGIALSDYMVFGDGDNDLGMIKAAPVSVAMGNALPAVKEAASYVTTDIDSDGIRNALQHYGLV